ncbi:MAG: penicillin-binding transpeptidase domain-containing protein [Rhizomicrobium sp.]
MKQRPDRHAIRAAKGRDKVLARMVREGVVTQGDADVARREGVPFARQAMPLTAPHLAVRLKLRDPHATRIVTTLDADLQGAVERMAANEQPYFGEGTALSIVVVDNRTRDVLAYLGGVNYWGPSGQIDLAQRWRSPGSALKPFIYGIAFDNLILHPASLMTDAPTMFGDYAPKDFEGSFQGAVSATEALRMSLNVPAVMVLDRVGPLAFTTTLENAGARLAFPAGGEGAEPSCRPSAGWASASPTSPCSMPASPMAARRAGCVTLPARRMRRITACSGRWRRSISSRSCAAYRCPMAGRWGRGIDRARRIAFKTGTSYGYRDAWSGRILQRLYGGRVGRPRRRVAARRPCRTRIRRAHPAQGLRASCRPTAMPTIRRRPVPCSPQRTTDCRRRCASSAARARRRRRARPMCRRRPLPFRPTARWCRCRPTTRRTRAWCSRPMAARSP